MTARRPRKATAVDLRDSVPLWPAAVLFSLALAAVALSALGAQMYVVFDRAAFFLALAGVASVVVLLYRPSSVLVISRLGVAWSAFLAWALLSAAASGRVWSALVGEATSGLGWATLFALTLVALASRALAPQMRRILIESSWVVVILQCAFVAIQLLQGADPGGTLVNSTYLGTFLLMLLPWVLADTASCPTWQRVARVATVFAALAVLAASGSRLSLLMALIWAGWTLVRSDSITTRIKIGLGAGAAAAVLLAVFAFSAGEVSTSLSTATLGERPQMYRMALKAVAERPIIGWGPDGFFAGGMATSTEADALAQRIIALMPAGFDPHNVLLLVAASTGLVGLGLFCWFLVEVVVRWRTQAPVGRGRSAAVWAVVMPFAVFLSAPSVLMVLVLFAIVLGLSLEIGADRQGRVLAVPVVARILLGLGAALVCLVFAANMATRAVFENASADVSPGLAASSMTASALWSADARLAYLSSLHLGYASGSNPAIAQSQLDLQAIKRAARLDRRLPIYPLEMARTLAFYQQPGDETEAAFRETMTRYPAYPEGSAEYALFLARAGRTAEARRYLALARALDDLSPERRLAIDATEELVGPSR